MSIQTTIAMANKATPVLDSVITSMEKVVEVSYEVQKKTGDMINTKSLIEAASELGNARRQISRMIEEEEKLIEEHNRYNESVKRSDSLLGGLGRKVAGIFSIYKAKQFASGFVQTSDELALIEARLSRIASEGESIADIQNQIYQSATRSRADYKLTADIVGRLGTQAGDAFGNTAELIAFSEQLNKHFVLSGTEVQGIESVMYNLSQAMSMGVLRGQDFNAVMSNAPSIAEAIANEMGVTLGEVKALADQGAISATIVKNALLNMADETNAAFDDIPKTWGQTMIEARNRILMAVQPVAQDFIAYINSGNFQVFMDIIINSLALMANWGAAGLQVLIEGFVTLQPILSDVAFGIGTLATATLAYRAYIKLATLAQAGFNVQLLISKLHYIAIIAAIGIVITALAQLIGAQRKQADDAVSGMERIIGMAYVTGAVFQNVITLIVNTFGWAGSIINRGFARLYGKIATFAELIDRIVGTNFSESVRAAQKIAEDASKFERREYVNLRDAYDRGAQFVKDREAQKAQYEAQTMNIEVYDDLAKRIDTGFADIAGINEDGNNRLKEIKSSVDRLDWNNNNLADLRGLMESRAINDLSRPVVLEVNNNITGNNISDTTDMRDLAEIVSEKIFNDAQVILAGGVE